MLPAPGVLRAARSGSAASFLGGDQLDLPLSNALLSRGLLCLSQGLANPLRLALGLGLQHASSALRFYIPLARLTSVTRLRVEKVAYSQLEFIAPPLVVFLSSTWEPLGYKSDLAYHIEETTVVERLQHSPAHLAGGPQLDRRRGSKARPTRSWASSISTC